MHWGLYSVPAYLNEWYSRIWHPKIHPMSPVNSCMSREELS
ncbi:hypothetical protein [Paenibacillus sp. Soil522]